MLTQFLVKNLDVVYFIYGLAFFVMGIAIFIQPRRKSIFKLSSIIWLLALFGLTHGLNEWLDMFDLIYPNNSHTYDLIQLTVLTLSYILLFEFGRRLVILSVKNFFMTKWVALTLYLSVFVLIFLVPTKQPSALPRYLLGIPGGLLTGFGFFYYYRSNELVFRPINIRRYFFVASVSIGIYGILGGFVTPRAEFFPASVIYAESFLSHVGIPAQMFRTICAVFLSWAIWNILYIFNWELLQIEWEIIEARATATAEHNRAEELQKVYRALEKSHLELKEAQSRLIQAEKMETVCRLASGAAHEVKNPLAIISQGVEYLKQNTPKDNENINLTLNYMEGAINRADIVIKGLFDFSALTKLDFRLENLNLVLDSAISLMQSQFSKYGIKVIKDYQEDLPLVKINKNRIEQVFINLILNAVQAMLSGGDLQIKTYLLQLDQQQWAAAQIQDSGPGIPNYILRKVFDPFFTTKLDSGGTGLGLSVARNVIDMHGGRLVIENRKDSHGVRSMVMFKT